MEREHLIIIALILVALYMMNNSSSTTDKVTAMGPMGRIRYADALGEISSPLGHIRTRREEFYEGDGFQPEHILLGDKDYGKGYFIKNHIRHNNRNNMFSGMMEGFRFTDVCDPSQSGMPC